VTRTTRLLLKTPLVHGAIVVLVVALVLGVRSSPAQAHEVCAYHTLDAACVLGGHTGIEVADNECDGHSVFAITRLADGRSFGIRDENGCERGITTRYFDSAIVSFEVCENTQGCSATVRVT